MSLFGVYAPVVEKNNKTTDFSYKNGVINKLKDLESKKIISLEILTFEKYKPLALLPVIFAISGSFISRENDS